MDAFIQSIGDLVEQGLGIDPGSILLNMIAFGILLFVIYRKVWQPLTDLLDERNKIITNDIEEAKQANLDASLIRDDMHLKLEAAKTEAKEIIEASRERGEVEKSKIISDAEVEAKAKLKKAEEDFEQEVQKVRENIKKEIVDVAFEVAEKIIEREVDSSSHTKTVDEFLTK